LNKFHGNSLRGKKQAASCGQTTDNLFTLGGEYDILMSAASQPKEIFIFLSYKLHMIMWSYTEDFFKLI